MEQKPRFLVSRLSDAAYISGCKNIPCIGLEFDPNHENRILFAFNISKEDGERYILEFGSSEAFAFDNSVKNLKGRIFYKLNERRGR